MRKSSSSHASLLFKRLRSVTPLAPGGHFLSRLTTLSFPATPLAPGGSSPGHVSPRASFKAEGSLSPLGEKHEHEITINPPPPPASPGPGNEKRSSQHAREWTYERESRGAAQVPSLAKPTPSSTIDFTLFALVRGLDTLVRVLPILLAGGGAVASAQGESTRELFRQSIHVQGKGDGSQSLLRRLLSKAGNFASNQAEGLVFAVCCGESSKFRSLRQILTARLLLCQHKSCSHGSTIPSDYRQHTTNGEHRRRHMSPSTLTQLRDPGSRI